MAPGWPRSSQARAAMCATTKLPIRLTSRMRRKSATLVSTAGRSSPIAGGVHDRRDGPRDARRDITDSTAPSSVTLQAEAHDPPCPGRREFVAGRPRVRLVHVDEMRRPSACCQQAGSLEADARGPRR